MKKRYITCIRKHLDIERGQTLRKKVRICKKRRARDDTRPVTVPSKQVDLEKEESSEEEAQTRETNEKTLLPPLISLSLSLTCFFFSMLFLYLKKASSTRENFNSRRLLLLSRSCVVPTVATCSLVAPSSFVFASTPEMKEQR